MDPTSSTLIEHSFDFPASCSFEANPLRSGRINPLRSCHYEKLNRSEENNCCCNCLMMILKSFASNSFFLLSEIEASAAEKRGFALPVARARHCLIHLSCGSTGASSRSYFYRHNWALLQWYHLTWKEIYLEPFKVSCKWPLCHGASDLFHMELSLCCRSLGGEAAEVWGEMRKRDISLNSFFFDNL